tara:strand:- start:9 stop:329 length:321 start_codon:yes stop_codon:yes gene_type:complete
MQSSISKEITGIKGYNNYVNKKGHPTNSHYSFERIESNDRSLHMYGWNTDVPAWDIKYTEDGFNYKTVGCVTAFPLDGVQASIGDDLTCGDADPYNAFVRIVNILA